MFLFPTDNLSVDQRASSPEKEDHSDISETAGEPIVAASPCREAADDLFAPEVTTQILCDTNVPQMQYANLEPSLSASMTEEEKSVPAVTDN